MSLVSCETPWKPATIATAPASSASRIRPGVTSMMRARPCELSVITPACEPVNDRASTPAVWIAIASSAMLIRSPAVSSMSSSRPGGSGVTCWARSSSSSVESPMAETATTTSWPSRRVATMRSATRLIRSASATEEPPYFCTTSPTVSPTPCDHLGCPARPHYRGGRTTPPGGKGSRMTGPDVPGTPGPPRPQALAAPTAGVHARGVRRSFGPVLAVQGIDLDAPPGQVTALVGPNGAGKTTVLLVLATLLRPDAGEVRVAGFDPVTQAGEVRARMGWSPDVFGLYDSLGCREYLEVMAAAYQVPKRARADRATRLLELARLPDKADAPVHSLSRGQKQRLGLVRALVHDPGVLLLDEPASGLDPRSRVELRDLLRRLAGEGRAVVVSSHILSDLEEVADRVVFVDAGRTVGQHAIGELPASRSVRTYRLRALDGPALLDALDRAGVGWVEGHSGVDVEVLGGEPSAARLLGELVAAGIAITAFAPLGGELEATYLDLVEGQR